MRIAAILLVLAAAARADAGDCADSGMTPTVLTPASTTIDQSGGVVVGLIDALGPRDTPDLAKLPWQFHEGKTRAAPRITIVAPGLAILAPVKPSSALDLEDDKQKALVHVGFVFASYDDKPIDAAPKVAGAKFTSANGRRMSSSNTTVTLAGPAPANAVALVVYERSGANPGKVKSWGRITPGATAVVIAHTRTCQAEPAGTIASPAGSEIVVEYLSAGGQLSLPSTPITVKS